MDWKRNKYLGKWPLLFVLPVAIWWSLALTGPLFDRPLAVVMEDTDGKLLGARIASDGQWRFPAGDSLPENFMTCVSMYEDRRFWKHLGVDFRALARASLQNIKAGRIVSGGSTLSMQVIRLSKRNPPRTLWQKFLEILLAFRLELKYTKANIIEFWASQAPFGGNVVGLEAASWRYYGKSPQLLSWAEAACLAVLPNSPALIHPGRNRDALASKRNRLLGTLLEQHKIDSITYQLALKEPLPEAPIPLPQLAPQLLDHLAANKGPGRWVVSLDIHLQERISELLVPYQRALSGNGIHNLAILVLETSTGKTLAYLGNAGGLPPEHSPQVDMVQAARSPGSILKPVLFSLALQDGLLLPRQLLADIPSVFGGFRPENFHQSYTGAVPASLALTRSLNIPFVHLLKDYGVGPFHHALNDWSFSFINKPPEHYGLSLILGGCEVSLWQVSGWYSSLARILLNYRQQQGQYDTNNWRLPYYLATKQVNEQHLQAAPFHVGAGAAWFTINALEKLERPDSEGDWEAFSSSHRMAWKTGTSFGFRDAWSVGVDPSYTIGVWVGNADGEGRPNLVGVQAAAPLLFAIRNLLPASSPAWFEAPLDDLQEAAVCQQSGYLATPKCPAIMEQIPATNSGSANCPFHQRIHLDVSGTYRLNQACLQASEKTYPASWFVLPPLQAHYYRQYNPHYNQMPEWRPDCRPSNEDGNPMQWIYPRQNNRIKIPRSWDGQQTAVIFSVAHRHPVSQIHWHLDGTYFATTENTHHLELAPVPGPHQLLLVDAEGNRISKDFLIEE